MEEILADVLDGLAVIDVPTVAFLIHQPIQHSTAPLQKKGPKSARSRKSPRSSRLSQQNRTQIRPDFPKLRPNITKKEHKAVKAAPKIPRLCAQKTICEKADLLTLI